MAMDNLKILRLEAEAVKRIRVVEITPTGALVELAGKNGEGKTSVLDSILFALGSGRDVQWEPIREGEERATIRVDLGNDEGLQLRVTRTFKRREAPGAKPFTDTLKIETADGRRLTGEATLLAGLVGALSFDPLEFARMKGPDQVALLKSLVEGVDFDAIAERRAGAYAARTDANRETKRLEAQANAVQVPAGTPDAPVDEAAIMEELANVAERAREVVEERSRRGRVEHECNRDTDEAGDLLARAEKLREEAAELERRGAALAHNVQTRREALAKLPPLPEAPSTEELQRRLVEAQAINRGVRMREERERLRAAERASQAEADRLTAEIAAADEEVRSAIESARLPVAGLTFDSDMVRLKGKPFEQASHAEQLRASLAIAIAMNPRLRVIRVYDGSLLDEDALEIVREVAEEEGFQIWMERVGAGSGPEAIIMENGMVRRG